MPVTKYIRTKRSPIAVITNIPKGTKDSKILDIAEQQGYFCQDWQKQHEPNDPFQVIPKTDESKFVCDGLDRINFQNN